MSRGSSRILIIPVGAVAIALAVASTAWACTTFLGTFTVWGDKNPAPSATKVVATGTGGGMNQTISGTAYASCLTSAQPAGGASCSTNRRGSVQVVTGTSTAGKLPAGNYDINYADRNAYPTHSTYKIDCMSSEVPNVNGVDNYIDRIGTVHVTSTGIIDTASSLIGSYAGFQLPSRSWTTSSNGGESAVCISDVGSYYGNQAPLTVI